MYVNYLTASEVADVCRQKLKTKGLFEDLVVCWLGGGGVLVCLFVLTWVILHLVFVVKPTNSQIIADYLSFSIQTKMSSLA